MGVLKKRVFDTCVTRLPVLTECPHRIVLVEAHPHAQGGLNLTASLRTSFHSLLFLLLSFRVLRVSLRPSPSPPSQPRSTTAPRTRLISYLQTGNVRELLSRIHRSQRRRSE